MMKINEKNREQLKRISFWLEDVLYALYGKLVKFNYKKAMKNFEKQVKEWEESH